LLCIYGASPHPSVACHVGGVRKNLASSDTSQTRYLCPWIEGLRASSRRRSTRAVERFRRTMHDLQVDQAETILRRLFHSTWERSKAVGCNICLERFSRKPVLDAPHQSQDLMCCQRRRQFESVAAYEAHQTLTRTTTGYLYQIPGLSESRSGRKLTITRPLYSDSTQDGYSLGD
jgi:hypothetical protein